MKDCEKTLVICYANVYGYDNADVPMYISDVFDGLRATFDESVKLIVLPTYDKSHESRIEVLNPRFVPEDEYKQIFENFNNKYDEIMQKFKEDGSNN